MFLAANVRLGTLPSVYIYSPKTPHYPGGSNWLVRFATPIWKLGLPALGFRFALSPIGADLKRRLRLDTGGGPKEAPGSRGAESRWRICRTSDRHNRRFAGC